MTPKYGVGELVSLSNLSGDAEVMAIRQSTETGRFKYVVDMLHNGKRIVVDEVRIGGRA